MGGLRVSCFTDTLTKFAMMHTQSAYFIVFHLTIGETWAVCQNVFPLQEVSPVPSPLYLVTGNLYFPASLDDGVFHSLIQKSMFRAPHFIHNSQ